MKITVSKIRQVTGTVKKVVDYSATLESWPIGNQTLMIFNKIQIIL